MLTIEGYNIEIFELSEDGLAEIIDRDNNYVYKGLLRECTKDSNRCHCYTTVKLESYTVEKISKEYREKRIIKKVLSKIDEEDDLCIHNDIDRCVDFVYDEFKLYNLFNGLI